MSSLPRAVRLEYPVHSSCCSRASLLPSCCLVSTRCALATAQICEILELAWPQELLNFIRGLYVNNRCRLVVGGAQFEGFDLTAGIRQGCPLSPLLFAVAADLLLRRLRRLCPSATIRAYADDLAMVLPNGAATAACLEQVFTEYAAISGLNLSLGLDLAST